MSEKYEKMQQLLIKAKNVYNIFVLKIIFFLKKL